MVVDWDNWVLARCWCDDRRDGEKAAEDPTDKERTTAFANFIVYLASLELSEKTRFLADALSKPFVSKPQSFLLYSNWKSCRVFCAIEVRELQRLHF